MYVSTCWQHIMVVCRPARLHAGAQCLAGAAPISLRSCSRVTNIAIFQEPRRRKLRKRVGGKGTARGRSAPCTPRQTGMLRGPPRCTAQHRLSPQRSCEAAGACPHGNTRQAGSLGTKPAPEGQRPLPERLHHHISHALVAALLAQGCGAGGKAGWQGLLRSRRGWRSSRHVTKRAAAGNGCAHPAAAGATLVPRCDG